MLQLPWHLPGTQLCQNRVLSVKSPVSSSCVFRKGFGGPGGAHGGSRLTERQVWRRDNVQISMEGKCRYSSFYGQKRADTD